MADFAMLLRSPREGHADMISKGVRLAVRQGWICCYSAFSFKREQDSFVIRFDETGSHIMPFVDRLHRQPLPCKPVQQEPTEFVQRAIQLEEESLSFKRRVVFERRHS